MSRFMTIYKAFISKGSLNLLPVNLNSHCGTQEITILGFGM